MPSPGEQSNGPVCASSSASVNVPFSPKCKSSNATRDLVVLMASKSAPYWYTTLTVTENRNFIIGGTSYYPVYELSSIVWRFPWRHLRYLVY